MSGTQFTCVTGTKVQTLTGEELLGTTQLAGISVRMLTGDSLLTAKHIAMECGILTREGTAMEGPDFRKLSEAAQKELLTVRILPNGHVQTLQVCMSCCCMWP